MAVDLRKTALSSMRTFIKDTIFPDVMNEVKLNLTGRIMKKRTGATLADVQKNSRVTRAGFSLHTTKPGLLAWMKGSRRRAFFVRPVHGKALTWKKGGKRFFSKGHQIPPWRFLPKKPVFEDAVNRTFSSGFDALAKAWPKEFNRTFRGGKLSIRLENPGR